MKQIIARIITPLELLYRFLAICIVGWVILQLYSEWQSGALSFWRLVPALIIAAWWAMLFWGAPRMLTERWIQSLPSSVWSGRPSRLVLPLVFLCAFGFFVGALILSSASVLFLVSSIPPWIFVVGGGTAILLTGPLLMGVVRFYTLLRAGKTPDASNF